MCVCVCVCVCADTICLYSQISISCAIPCILVDLNNEVVWMVSTHLLIFHVLQSLY